MKSVTLYDPELVQVEDLGTQVSYRLSLFLSFNAQLSFLKFFLRAEDIGKPRAAVTVPRLAELNSYVPVRDLGGSAGQPITTEAVKGFQVRNLTRLTQTLLTGT